MFDKIDLYLAIFKELAEKTAGQRRPGAASLDLAYVACGRYDGFWEFGLAPWDMAGRRAADFRSRRTWSVTCAAMPTYLETGNLIAGTPKVFAPLLKLAEGHLPDSVRGEVSPS